ncbi:MAG: hypothetical protein HGA31_00170 [Candidatus Moranbacteria bacterium]|nr:hypothetical protein [Candidatus Moranbacteria bacterium]
MGLEGMKDRMKAAMLFVAIGDALGMPAEIYSAKTIAKRFGRIRGYVDPPKDHRFHGEGMKAGMWTDDWCHTQACAESIIDVIRRVGRGFPGSYLIDCDDISRRLVSDSCMLISGMGGSTRKALEKIRAGIHWSESGTENGAGNGVAMKAAPFGMILASAYQRLSRRYSVADMEKRFSEYRVAFDAKMIKVGLMTHATQMGAASGLAQAYAVFASLTLPDEDFETRFLEIVIDACLVGENILSDDVITDRISDRLRWMLETRCWEHMNIGELSTALGKGSCYAFDSIPFTYAMFLRNPRSIVTLFDTVNAGGDTDSNGSMVGALLGARNGMALFEGHEHLIDGLWRKEAVIQTATELAEALSEKQRSES